MSDPDNSPVPAPAPRSRRRVLAWTAGIILAVPVLLIGGLVVWAGSDGSLPRTLQLAQRFLPAGQQLAFDDASGSLAGGGRIGRLLWSSPGVALRVEELRLDWSLRELFSGALHVRELSAREVHVLLTPQPDEPPPEPFVMPREVSLPIRVTLPVEVARLQIETIDSEGVSAVQVIEALQARYAFDGTLHTLRLESLQYGQNRLQADATLHARDLDLVAEVAASLRDLAPEVPFSMQMRLHAEGTLAGEEAAQLRLRLDAREQRHDAVPLAADRLLQELTGLRTTLEEGADVPATDGAQLHLLATLHPWRAQPVEQARLLARGLNARAFHAAAPDTAFRADVQVTPVPAIESAWDFHADVANDRPGAWDAGQVPLQAFTARATLAGKMLRIDGAQLQLAGERPAGGLELDGEIPVKEWTASVLRLSLQQLDLQPLMGGLPRTALHGELVIEPLPGADEEIPATGRWQARADIRNALPGPLDRERAPLERLLAELHVTPERWQAQTLQLQVGGGRLEAQGHFEPEGQVLVIRSTLQRLPLRQIHGDMSNGLDAELSGTLTAEGSLQQSVVFAADISSNAGSAAGDRAAWEIRAIGGRGSWSPTRLLVERVHVDAFQARIDGSEIDVVLPGLDAIAARLTAAAPGMTLDADAAMRQQSGGGQLSLQIESATETVEWLRGLPLIGERLPLTRAGGSASLEAGWQGGWQQWLQGFERPERHPDLRLDVAGQVEALHVVLAGTDDAEPLRIDVESLDLVAQGNLAAATLVVDGDLRVDDTQGEAALRLQMTRRAGNAGAPLWELDVEQLTAAATMPEQSGPWRLQLGEGLQLGIETGDGLQLRATAGSATLAPPAGMAGDERPLELVWEPLLWRQSAAGATTLQSRGVLRGLQPGWADALPAADGQGLLAAAGLYTDLNLDGEWDIQLADRLDVRAHLQRTSGDAWLLDVAPGDQEVVAGAPGRGLAAGIREFDVRVQSEGEAVSLALNWDTARAGVITAQLQTTLARQGGGWQLPEAAPLSGTVQAQLQDLGAWTFLAPPGWRVQGQLGADIRLSGTVQAPELRGDLQAQQLNIRSVLDGVDLHDGVLRASLEGQQLRITELTLQGGTGSRAYVRGLSGNRTPPPTNRGRFTASGTIDWSGVATAGPQQSGIEMDLQAQLERMQVLVRNDRQVTLSGELSAGLHEGALQVRGDVRVDRAAIMLPDAGAPTLGDDVVVVRAGDPAPEEVRGQLETAAPMDLELKLDLGRDLALQGHGITTRLEGELTVRSVAGGADPFQVIGEVRTVEGRYRAWGQALNVETGVVVFNGPYANPSLNLLAIRPEIDVRAGVRVTGTVSAPRVQLYSEPDLPEAEKLSWVVLGRATATGGAEGASMQQAALGLLAGGVGAGLAGTLGLDELGLSESSVSIGKRISDELYVTYEAGLSGAASMLYVFYDITRRLTLRGQTGDASAVDLIYTFSFD